MSIAPEDATRAEIQAAVAEWRAVRAERLAIEKEAAKVREHEVALKEFIVSAMLSQKYEGVVKDNRLTYVRVSQVPMASDRAEFENYILSTGQLDLLQFRPAVGAIKERVDAGVVVPGISWVEVYDLGDKKA